MKRVYLDNASTTFPKPKEVAESVYRYMVENGCNVNRGCYSDAYAIEEIVYETRQFICNLFHGDNLKNVVFTKNVTESLNIVLKGFLKKGDHVIVSSMEHNAVMRPLVQLEKSGITFTRVQCGLDGSMSEETLKSMSRLVKKNTKAVIMTHASNVCGTLLPLSNIGEFCQNHHLRFIVDCAQTAGVYPIDMKRMKIDALCFTGHKGLLGPQGIGGMLLREDMISEVPPLLSGGTGSLSHTENIPDFMPDRYEAGTMNLPGIIGLHEGLRWLKETGIDTVRKHEMLLTEQFLQGMELLEQRDKIRIIGKRTAQDRTGVVSIQTLEKELAETAYELEQKYQIMVRVGLHCAPSAHHTLQTFPIGTIRFSFGYWNTEKDIETAIKAMEELTNGF